MRSARFACTLLVALALALPISQATAGPTADAPCDGVRPGAHVTTSEGTGGTLNFLFRGSDGRRYIATAGHLLADEATHVWERGTGPSAEIDDGTRIGRAVFASNHNAGNDDFALIEVDRGIAVDPAVCHWGGPTGLNDDVTTEATVLRMYGSGMGISEVAPERTLLAPNMTHPTQVGALGVAIFGDSGSPVISADGRAVGVQYVVGVILGDPVNGNLSPGTVAIARLGPQVKLAERALGIELKLVEAPLADA